MGIASPRSAWTSFRPNFTTGPKKVKVVYIHHSAAADEGDPISETAEFGRMRSIESTHINERGWLCVGYSFVVFGSGRACEGRGWGHKQGGNYDGGTNESTYSVCFDGDFGGHAPTDAAFATAAALIAEGVALGWIDPDYELRGHREEIIPPGVRGKEHCAGMRVVDCTGKDCPGKFVYTQFDRLEDDLTPEQKALLDGLLKMSVKGGDEPAPPGVIAARIVSGIQRTERKDTHHHITAAGKPTGPPVKP